MGANTPLQRLLRRSPRQARRPDRRLKSPMFHRDSAPCAQASPGGIRAVLAPPAPTRKESIWARTHQGPQPPPGAPGPSTQQRDPNAPAAERGPLTLLSMRPAFPPEDPSKRRGRRPPLASGGRTRFVACPGTAAESRPRRPPVRRPRSEEERLALERFPGVFRPAPPELDI
ncbi:hypothetical protein NDU88_007101 [Pleurodeles waltl]|uniref:Uncharacterized protein n=1 Tax=Pleurodeles waltl TaxID=8319 RepID=A0AAV7RNG2_PLEWA|nr:hypothetical protein NDU88_007101 [Pleurodeles waltl]